MKDSPSLFEKAIASVFSNSIIPSQFILVCDGPLLPPLYEIIKIYQIKYPCNFEVFFLPKNKGLAAALNYGMNFVSNEFVVRADSDDINHQNRFEYLIRFLISNPDIGIVSSWVNEVDESGRFLAIKRVPREHKEILQLLPYRNPFNHMAVAFRKSCFILSGGYPQLYLKEDYGLWAKFISLGIRGYNIQESLVDVSAGRPMIERRGGVAYIKSEFNLYMYMLRLNISSVFIGFMIFLIRSFIFAMPAKFRYLVYKFILRS